MSQLTTRKLIIIQMLNVKLLLFPENSAPVAPCMGQHLWSKTEPSYILVIPFAAGLGVPAICADEDAAFAQELLKIKPVEIVQSADLTVKTILSFTVPHTWIANFVSMLWSTFRTWNLSFDKWEGTILIGTMFASVHLCLDMF
jgi:hypothetical protein